MENPDSRAIDEATAILGDAAEKHQRQSEVIDDLQFISSMLLLYTQETLDGFLSGNLKPEAAHAFESLSNGVSTVVSTVKAIHRL